MQKNEKLHVNHWALVQIIRLKDKPRTFVYTSLCETLFNTNQKAINTKARPYSQRTSRRSHQYHKKSINIRRHQYIWDIQCDKSSMTSPYKQVRRELEHKLTWAEEAKQTQTDANNQDSATSQRKESPNRNLVIQKNAQLHTIIGH